MKQTKDAQRNCKDSIYNDPKLVLGSNIKGSNNKFVDSGPKD